MVSASMALIYSLDLSEVWEERESGGGGTRWRVDVLGSALDSSLRCIWAIQVGVWGEDQSRGLDLGSPPSEIMANTDCFICDRH